MAYKYINFEKVEGEKFVDAITLLLDLPVSKRDDFDSIEMIEQEMEFSKSKELKILKLQTRDYVFLKSQLDYALGNRMLRSPKQWKQFVDAVDEAKGIRPENYPGPEKKEGEE